MSDNEELDEIIEQAMQKKAEREMQARDIATENVQSTTDDEVIEEFRAEITSDATNEADAQEAKPKKKKEKKKWSTKRKVITIVIIILLVILLAVGGVLLFLWHMTGKINYVPSTYDNSVYDSIVESPPEVENPKKEPDSPQDEIKNLEEELRKNLEANREELVFTDNVLNILLIGTDSKDNSSRGRSDSMILLSINKKTHDIVMTSIMRDIYVSIPGKENNRINAAYAFGGPELLIDTVEQAFGIRIDNFVQVDFTSFEKVINAVGGVSIKVNEDEAEIIRGIDSAGTYTLNGKQALTYARIRYVGNADFERTQRQRIVLEELLRKAKSLSLTKMYDFLNESLPLITTDLTQGQLFSLVLDAPFYLSYDKTQLRIPSDDMFKYMRIDGRSVLGIDFDGSKKLMVDTIYG